MNGIDWSGVDWDAIASITGPRWKSALRMQAMMLSDTFPSEKGFDSSQWADWVKRIEAGHDQEDSRTTELVEKWEAPAGSENSGFEPGNWIIDAYWQSAQVSGYMYAALVVSIWACMEGSLKSVLDACALSSQKHVYQFKDIKSSFNAALSIDFQKIRSFGEIDAIRIMNNSFKHSGGAYEPDPQRPWTIIDASVLKNWRIIDTRNEIQFSELPIKELVIACNDFISTLLHLTETGMEALDNAE